MGRDHTHDCARRCYLLVYRWRQWFEVGWYQWLFVFVASITLERLVVACVASTGSRGRDLVRGRCRVLEEQSLELQLHWALALAAGLVAGWYRFERS